MRTLKSIVFTVPLLFAVNSCRAQIFRDWWKDYRYGIHAAYSWQGNSSVEIGAYRMWSSNPLLERRTYNWDPEEADHKILWSPLGFWSTGSAVEFSFGRDEFVAGPKLFSELNLSLVSFSLSTTSYTNFKRVDMRVTPGIGISFFGTFGVRYERNIALQNSIFGSIQPNRFIVFINIIKDDFPGY